MVKSKKANEFKELLETITRIIYLLRDFRYQAVIARVGIA